MKHRERLLEASREKHQRRREAEKIYRRAYYVAHREERRIYGARWRTANRERHRAMIKAWRAAHPAEVLIYRQRRLAHVRGVSSTLTPAEWLTIIAAFDGCCAYCGRNDHPLTQDHVIPLSKGGAHCSSNIVPACRSCNSRKGNRLIIEP